MKNLFYSVFSVLLCAPIFVFAATGVDNTQDGISLQNPIGDKSITEFLISILDVIMIFAVPLIVFMFIYAGFKYVMAQGDTTKVGEAHRALLYAVIGAVIVLGAKALLEVIQGTVDALK